MDSDRPGGPWQLKARPAPRVACGRSPPALRSLHPFPQPAGAPGDRDSVKCQCPRHDEENRQEDVKENHFVSPEERSQDDSGPGFFFGRLGSATSGFATGAKEDFSAFLAGDDREYWGRDSLHLGAVCGFAVSRIAGDHAVGVETMPFPPGSLLFHRHSILPRGRAGITLFAFTGGIHDFVLCLSEFPE